ncbi:MAG: response regulator [Burkholderiaceae bacterium]|nr:response regulator [Burkholderiaceae bacterium]
MRQVAAGQLRALGAENIHLAGNGAEALQLMSHQRIDLILSDWNMPVMDGLALLRELRADARLAAVPLVLVTAEVERDRVGEAIRSGVSDLLVKPYTARRMEEKITGALRGSARVKLAGMPESQSAQPSQTDKPTILVVDDTPENLRLIADLFADKYRVRVADNGRKALAICSADVPPDLVLLDVMMPDMDGFEVARRMREHPNSETIPVIFVTALSDDRSRRRGFDLGAVDFVVKPIDPDILHVRVDNFIRYVQLHKQRQAEYDAMLRSARMREHVERMLRHDLRGPLAGVTGLLRELGADSTWNQAQRERLAQIEAAAQQALDTVHLSGELFNVENGSYQPQAEAVALPELLRQVAQLARAAFAARQLQFRIDLPGEAVASGDPSLCRAVFHNLLRNACEAAPQGGWVAISIHPGARPAVVIANRGAVPPEMRERFFERYATFGKPGGSGIGTYSAKRLVEAQGGAIAMETSDADDSTTITVELPAACHSAA